MFNGNLQQQQQSVAAMTDAHMQMANLILSANQNQLQTSHPFYGNMSGPLITTTNNNNNSPSTADIQRMQQWFRHNDTSPYTSPLPSNAPSMGDISALSLFTENSTLTLNSHLSSSSRIIKTENLEATKTNDYLKFFKSVFSGQETVNKFNNF
uniref:Uncharacterized protein n=1 Tax=Meloidogyne hapla TaxID=6305 RepID=A0A1I8BB72_MELHA